MGKAKAIGGVALGATDAFLKVKSAYDAYERQEARDKKLDDAINGKNGGANAAANGSATQSAAAGSPGFSGTQEAAPIDNAVVTPVDPVELNPIQQAQADSLAMADEFKAITATGG